MKHLDVLSNTGEPVARTKLGRTVTCRLNAAPMKNAIAWLNRYERFWSEALQRLAAFLEEDEIVVDTAVRTGILTVSGGSGALAKVFAAWDRPGKNKALDGPGRHCH